MRTVGIFPGAWRKDAAGAAAVEFALILPILALPMLNIFDIGVYTYTRMQVENAAQMGAQAAWSLCSVNAPAMTCANFSTTLSTALQSTPLGASVTEVAGSPSEGYYCATTTGGLTLVGTSSDTVGTAPIRPSPFNCDAVANHSAPAGTQPGDYVVINVTYTYSPIFPALSMASLLPSNITKTVWTRLA